MLSAHHAREQQRWTAIRASIVMTAVAVGHAGMLPPEMKRLKLLEDENGRLKRIVADPSLDKEMLQDVLRRKL